VQNVRRGVPPATRSASAGERVLKRLCGAQRRTVGKHAGEAKISSPAVPSCSITAAAHLLQHAPGLLINALGGGERAKQTAEAAVKAFVATQGASEARRSIQALCSAVRANIPFRADVLAKGPEGVMDLVEQDSREWATKEMHEKRLCWKREALNEAGVPGSQITECPECGGRATVECGRAGTGRAARLSKQYAHYKCLEERCGKVTHLKEG